MKNLLILISVGIATLITSCCCKTYPPKTPFPDIETVINNVEIYMARVTFVDTITKGSDTIYNNLIQLYGTNQTFWRTDKSLFLKDVVKIKTKDQFLNYELEVLCSPKEDHCHFDGSGEHSKMHITEIGVTSNDYDRVLFNGVDYETVHSTTRNGTINDIVWLNIDFQFRYGSTQDSLYGILLMDTTSAYQRIDGKFLIFDYTLNEHTGH